MKNNKIRKVLSGLMAVVMAFVTINVNITKADEGTPAEEKYAGILSLYKSVDETLQLLIERADNDELGYRTYFVKSESDTLNTSEWGNIVNKSSGEYISLFFEKYNDCKYTFKVGDYYYHTLRIELIRAYTTSEHKKEMEEKAKYIEESLGLFSEEMCDYEKAVIIFKYIVDNVEYGSGLYNGRTKSDIVDEIGIEEFRKLLDEGLYQFDKLYSGQTPYEALIYGEAVCGGYARTYNTMLADCGIKSFYITSYGSAVPHAWNLVQLGNIWYFCDATASDPMNSITITSNEDGYIWFYNFMQGSIEDSEIPHHEIDTYSKDVIKYFNCTVPEENMDSNGSFHDAFCQICEYMAPSCTEPGVQDINCDYCNDRHRIEIPVTHYYTYEAIVNATCTNDGSGVATCTLCGNSYTYEVPRKEHCWNFVRSTTTCESDGYEKIYCEDCNDIYWLDTTPAYIHDWSEWVEASVTKYKRTCSKCNEEQQELKTVIDGEPETTTTAGASEEDKTPMDRGYGITAYYSEAHGYWVYIDKEWGESYLFEGVGVWVESLGEYVVWDEETHTFKRVGEDTTTTTKIDVTTTAEVKTTVNGEYNTTTAVDGTNPVETTTMEETTKASETTKVQETTRTPRPTTTVKAVPDVTTVKTPAKVRLRSAKNKNKKSVTLKWRKAANARKYQIQISLSKKFKTKKKYKTVIRTTKKLALRIRKLTKKRTYYFRVRGVNGKVYGKWSKVKRVKVKK